MGSGITPSAECTEPVTRGVRSLLHSVSHCRTEDETQLDLPMSVHSLPSAAGKPELQMSQDDIQNQAGPCSRGSCLLLCKQME